MDVLIKSKINARKILFSYLYERIFAENVPHHPLDSHPQSLRLSYDNFHEEIDYVYHHFFQKIPREEVDFDFIYRICESISLYSSTVAELVDSFSKTFVYKNMDIVDKVVFLMGYVEYQVHKTDKKVIINEMVELCKKYGDDGSSKLINAILHQMIP